MSTEDSLTPLEQEIGKRLGARPLGNCLDAAELCELAVHGASSPRYDAGMAHVVSCASCRFLLRQFQECEASSPPDPLSLNSLTPRGTRLGGRGGESSPRIAGLGSYIGGMFSGRGRWVAAGSMAVVAAMLVLVGNFVLAPMRTVAVLQDEGATIRLTAGNQLSGLPSLESEQRTLIAAALRTGRLETPAVLAGLRGPSGSGSEPPAFPATGPTCTVVATAQPEFTWKMPAEAVACSVSIDSLAEPRSSLQTKPLKSDHWKPKKPLAAGQAYQWQLVARDRAGKELGRVPRQMGAARFKVLETDRAMALDRARAKLGRSHLAMGVLYGHEGMLDEAEREFEALLRANSASELARSLLDGIRRMRAANS